jgi:hypothetical protein
MISDCDLMISDCDLMISDCDLLISDCDLLISDCDLLISDCGWLISDCEEKRAVGVRPEPRALALLRVARRHLAAASPHTA